MIPVTMLHTSGRTMRTAPLLIYGDESVCLAEHGAKVVHREMHSRCITI
jgi:hypothetical protein